MCVSAQTLRGAEASLVPMRQLRLEEGFALSKDLEGTAVRAPLDEEAPAPSAASVMPRAYPTRFARVVGRFLPPTARVADLAPPVDTSTPAGAPPDFADTEATWWSLA